MEELLTGRMVGEEGVSVDMISAGGGRGRGREREGEVIG